MAKESERGKFTNARLTAEDAAMLSQLAVLLGKPVADVFTERFAEPLRKALISEQKRRTAELERRGKGQE